MNEQNYATLEASQRLVAKGIMLVTDFCWYGDGINFIIDVKGKDYINGVYGYGGKNDSCIPAPSMAEVWRELPDKYESYPIEVCKREGSTYAAFPRDYQGFKRFDNTNPTGALIDLLIWVTEQNEKEEGKS